MPNIQENAESSIGLLKELIAIPSFSGQEQGTADAIAKYLRFNIGPCEQYGNNVIARSRFYSPEKPTILLNSHHDTVKPNAGYTLNPFEPIEEDGKLYGLGSNDAGASLVALLAVFLYYYPSEGLPFNLIFAATAEEEISGKNGIEMVLPHFWPIDFAIVGEPTQMKMATAEKGLMVIDCIAAGIAGHAAREEGENAIYKAMQAIEKIKQFQFPIVSERLGPIKMSVTIIQAGTQHNVVPDECRFTVDVRCTDAYSLEETLAILNSQIFEPPSIRAKPRSMRLRPSSISNSHPFVQAGLALGLETYGSPTTSDQALMPFQTVKMGPGDSARSHTADEFVYLEEIFEGARIYLEVLERMKF